MAGGKPDIFENIKPFLEAAAARDPDNNICAKRLGDAAEVGHFVKMVHNSIEYAEMQLLSEVYSQFAEIKGYNNEDISKEENIKNILSKCEIKPNDFKKGIEDQKIKNELKDLTSIAFQNDVFGAPTFVINNNLFWGQDRLEFALDELNN